MDKKRLKSPSEKWDRAVGQRAKGLQSFTVIYPENQK